MSHGSWNNDGKYKWTVLLQQTACVGRRRVAKSISVLKALCHVMAKTFGLIFRLIMFCDIFDHRTLLPGNRSSAEHHWWVMFGQVKASSHWHHASLQIDALLGRVRASTWALGQTMDAAGWLQKVTLGCAQTWPTRAGKSTLLILVSLQG